MIEQTEEENYDYEIPDEVAAELTNESLEAELDRPRAGIAFALNGIQRTSPDFISAEFDLDTALRGKDVTARNITTALQKGMKRLNEHGIFEEMDATVDVGPDNVLHVQLQVK